MTDIAEALTLPDAPDLEDDEQRERWTVRSDRAASWALRKLRGRLDEIERIKRAVDDEVAMLKAWGEAALAGPMRDVRFFEAVLINYRLELEAQALEKGNELPKTYKVPGGTIARRKSADKIEIVDEQALVKWCIRNGLFDLLKITPQVSELKNIATAQHDELVHEEGEPVELDPQGRLVIVAGDDIEEIPGVVHLIREDTYNAKPDA